MFPHHAETVRRTSEHFEKDADVRKLILANSIAHGFCMAASDVDVFIIISNKEHQTRLRSADTCFFSRELCTFPDGYVDGKYVSTGFLQEVSAKGSEPARYAFKDARVLFSNEPELHGLVQAAARYPVEHKAERIWRFQAQFEAWSWYASEALKSQNLPLLRTAISKLTLFGGRLILANNELLYPYYKWFLRVLESAPQKPEGVIALIESLAQAPDSAAITRFGEMIRAVGSWRISHATWPAQFMRDSELNWLESAPPIDDI